jgi:hypothetical protein
MSGYDADRLAFFKDKMQEFGQSLESRALHRLSMEYAKKTSPNLSEYPIEFIDPFHWTVMHIVHGEPVKLDIQFSKDYPFSAPQVEIVEPYVFRFNIAGLFGLQGFNEQLPSNGYMSDSRILYQTVRVFFEN